MSYREEFQRRVAAARAEHRDHTYSLCDVLEGYDLMWKDRLIEAMFGLPEFSMETDGMRDNYLEIINDISRCKCYYGALHYLFFMKAEMLCEKYSEAARATWIKN